MDQASKDFLVSLLETPGPSGYEERVQQIVRDYAADFADEITTDVHGNVICAINPDAGTKLMFAGHCDQIGMLVSHWMFSKQPINAIRLFLHRAMAILEFCLIVFEIDSKHSQKFMAFGH